MPPSPRLDALCRPRRTSVYLTNALVLVLLSAPGCGSDASSAGTGGGGAGGTASASTGSGGSTTSNSSSSSSSGTGGSTAVQPVAELDPRDIATAAVFVGSCMPDDGINRMLNLFYTNHGGPIWYEQPLAERLGCLKGKTNGCKALEDCFGYHLDATGPCEITCDNDVLTRCEGTTKFQFDCKKFGMACSPQLGLCVQAPLAPACDPATFQAKCDAGAPVTCHRYAGEIRGPTCADDGLACVSFSATSAGCQGTGAACDSTSGRGGDGIDYDVGIACDGQQLRACVNSREDVVDCNTLGKGFTCQSGTSAFCGLATECSPGAGAATCDGNNVVFCNAGRIEKIDCTALGFTGCTTEFKGGCAPLFFGN